ncbi:hypothetical protein UFOVP755_71 [uncultured Caudovirales phage]|jgi:hypothetical protein|uniref:Uncharacterized protein n=1 Tax=uncultured Caudovirales phage TaxID=2100421 RepID=A0A6J7X6B7_9CAUD|nr:hypothetical protein UFOVP755_71 [uncultured Caudovirales phage]
MNDTTKQQLLDIFDGIKTDIVDGVDRAVQKTIPSLGRRYNGTNDYIKIIMDNGIGIRKTKNTIQYFANGSMDLNTLEQTYPSLPSDVDQSIHAVADRLYQNIHDQFKNKRPRQAKPIVQPPPFIKP